MRISVLSRSSGVPVPTIKYYLREGLLPPGEATARNQASYDETHLRRLRLIRTLTGIGGLDLSSVRALLAAIEDDRAGMADLYRILNRNAYPAEGQDVHHEEGIEQARRDAAGFVAAYGWRQGPLPADDPLVRAVAALRELGCDASIGVLAPMAEAADRLARDEFDMLQEAADAKAVAVVRTVLFDVVFAALRRMAREHQVVTRFSPGAEPA